MSGQKKVERNFFYLSPGSKGDVIYFGVIFALTITISAVGIHYPAGVMCQGGNVRVVGQRTPSQRQCALSKLWPYLHLPTQVGTGKITFLSNKNLLYIYQ